MLRSELEWLLALFEAYKTPISYIPQAMDAGLPSLISDWLHNPELMNHFVMEENKDALCTSTFELKESLRTALKEVSSATAKLDVEQQTGKESANEGSEIDIERIPILSLNLVKEVALFESLMCFFREAGEAGIDFDQLKGLSDTFIHSYCSMLDLVCLELLQGHEWREVFLNESSSLLMILRYLGLIFDKLSQTLSFGSFDKSHYAILKTEKFLVKLHDVLNYMVSNQGLFHQELNQIITNLIYLPTLLNDHLRNRIKTFVISDCRLKVQKLEHEFNPDLLQMMYFDLILLNKLARYGSKDQEIFRLLMDLAELNVTEVRLYLIRFCLEKGWDYDSA